MSLDFILQVTVDTGDDPEERVKFFEINYTHNAVPMWKLAGCYDALYDSHGLKAYEVIEPLESAYQKMLENPEEYKKLNPTNGWGSYDTALRFLKATLDACKKYYKTTIYISR